MVTSRVRAPELRGRRWLNTGGAELSLAQLRGKIVLLDFWTFCCVNCLHVLDELRELEERYADVLVTVGVHSPKFAHEGEPAAVEAAVERYGVAHPVLDDPELVTWDAYAARAWPTLVVVDPQGYVVAHLSGEGHAHGIGVLVEELIAQHGDHLRRGDGPVRRSPGAGDRAALPGQGDRAARRHVPGLGHRAPPARGAGGGPGDRGAPDRHGRARVHQHHRSTSPRASPCSRTATSWWPTRSTTPCAGSGSPTGTSRPSRAPVTSCATGCCPVTTAKELSTPWDVAWWDGTIAVAMAGSHQIWTWDPATGATTVLAGTTNEGLRDGPPADAFFAQPSGLAPGIDADGDVLWVADAETSAVRRLTRDLVTTATGQGLFDFGHRDGPAAEALLQHPLGVAVLPDGSIAVADTYNGAIRRYDPRTATVSTLAEGLAEPSDLLVDGETLIVVESAAHRLVRVPIPAGAQVDGAAHTVRRPRTDLAAGPVTLRVAFTPPTGQHLDTRFGDPTQLTVAADPPELLVRGAGTAPGLVRELELCGHRGSAVGQRRGRRVRRGRRRLRRLPPLPAGLGHPRPPDGRRARRARPGPARYPIVTRTWPNMLCPDRRTTGASGPIEEGGISVERKPRTQPPHSTTERLPR